MPNIEKEHISPPQVLVIQDEAMPDQFYIEPEGFGSLKVMYSLMDRDINIITIGKGTIKDMTVPLEKNQAEMIAAILNQSMQAHQNRGTDADGTVEAVIDNIREILGIKNDPSQIR